MKQCITSRFRRKLIALGIFNVGTDQGSHNHAASNGEPAILLTARDTGAIIVIVHLKG
jgi:hypothetical protein